MKRSCVTDPIQGCHEARIKAGKTAKSKLLLGPPKRTFSILEQHILYSGAEHLKNLSFSFLHQRYFLRTKQHGVASKWNRICTCSGLGHNT